MNESSFAPSPHHCPLCSAPELASFFTTNEGAEYFHCSTCDLRSLHGRHRLSLKDERSHYELHENDVHDPRYRKFVSPLFDAVSGRLTPGATGLDFGAGSGPILATLFGEAGYATEKFDPFFWPDRRVLERTYDFVVTSEVVEHFNQPQLEFPKLRALLAPGGVLGIMTHLYDSSIDFASWYYRRDPTHVVFYSKATFGWIARECSFSSLTFEGERVVVLTAKA